MCNRPIGAMDIEAVIGNRRSTRHGDRKRHPTGSGRNHIAWRECARPRRPRSTRQCYRTVISPNRRQLAVKSGSLIFQNGQRCVRDADLVVRRRRREVKLPDAAPVGRHPQLPCAYIVVEDADCRHGCIWQEPCHARPRRRTNFGPAGDRC